MDLVEGIQNDEKRLAEVTAEMFKLLSEFAVIPEGDNTASKILLKKFDAFHSQCDLLCVKLETLGSLIREEQRYLNVGGDVGDTELQANELESLLELRKVVGELEKALS